MRKFPPKISLDQEIREALVGIAVYLILFCIPIVPLILYTFFNVSPKTVFWTWWSLMVSFLVVPSLIVFFTEEKPRKEIGRAHV